MACVFTTDVKCGKTNITVNAFDESFGKWVYLKAFSPNIDNIGYLESGFNVPHAHAAAIGTALIAAAKAAGWVETIEAVREVETVDAA
jgi:hypothetical protein